MISSSGGGKWRRARCGSRAGTRAWRHTRNPFRGTALRCWPTLPPASPNREEEQPETTRTKQQPTCALPHRWRKRSRNHTQQAAGREKQGDKAAARTCALLSSVYTSMSSPTELAGKMPTMPTMRSFLPAMMSCAGGVERVCVRARVCVCVCV